MSIIENKIIGNTLIITLNNPSKRNSMIKGFHDEFQSAIKIAEEDKNVCSVVIAGQGDFFCAGGDLNALKTRRSMTEPERYQTLNQLNGTIESIYNCSKPIIAAIEGGAAGAGVSLAMACDLVVMSEYSFFSLAYVKIGLTPDGAATKFLSETMPRQMLAEMAMIGGKIDASRLYNIGAVNVLAQKGNAKETAVELSKNFENLPKNSISRIKKLSRAAYGNDFSKQIKLETDYMVKSQGDKESMEGIDAFLEKRTPDYKKLR
ncbi:enoyl-CoA hydratase family protein [Alphaproteobacteria bacterium]|nr:enoyl-CoA hydratase family protein [Alphaproteobacteria bacterium]